MDPVINTVAILCGGRGLRLQEHTQAIPKPLIDIGGRPILWHVMQLYMMQGTRRFVLCLGYKGELIERFVKAEEWPSGIEVVCLDTGVETATGERLGRSREVIGGEPFWATYADGVADIDLAGLAACHRASGRAATLTVVQPQLQFGVAELDRGGRVRGFREKPQLEEWVNGGFFCFEPQVLDLLVPGSVLEREPLEKLSGAGQLQAYRHEGFWDCLDTYKDALLLNDLWSSGEAPWKIWE